jgi:rare lipoprotein A
MKALATFSAAVAVVVGSASADELKYGTVPWAGALPVQQGNPAPSKPGDARSAAPQVVSKGEAARAALRPVLASYYSQGTLTASGERFAPMGLTAAHRSLPFGTKLRVTNPRTGKSVVVRVNDRGPLVRGVVLSLSLGAARSIGLEQSGVAPVTMEIVSDKGGAERAFVASQER